MTLKNEVLRKSIHLLLLVLPAGMMVLGRREMLLILGILFGTAAIVEAARRLHGGFEAFFLRITGSLLREHERSRITGATYLLLSALICVLIFRPWIAQVALLFVIISDGLSALAGKWLGKRSWGTGKTWEGNIVFIVSGLLIILLHPYCTFTVGLFGLMAAFISDVYITGIDDNLTIPLISGIVMEGIVYLV